ncbi:MAG: glutamine--fructose-6-phosphate transaminase (isomerizing) [Proteobacteria bacterium]|nr:glutamine--fructose-6-phosphate transaminase (isomerizing) [Pseudomonadota bacterium]
MCGIVGYVGRAESAQEMLLDGLRRLEYRGYDSAGIAVIDDGQLQVVRAKGKLGELESALRASPLSGSIGIGHTRWATHGKPSESNAHPHVAGPIAVIGNGIVENFRELRERLSERGCRFSSETDTEIIAHLIAEESRRGAPLAEALRGAVAHLEGSYAIAVLDERTPDRIAIAKNAGNPIVAGCNGEAAYVASDIPTLLPYTRRLLILQDEEIGVVRADRIELFGFDGTPVEREETLVQWDPVQAEKGGYERFMQKEIHEQPRAIGDTIGARVLEDEGDLELDGIELEPREVEALQGISLVGCGTAWHACLLGRLMIERLARIPCDVDIASEFRYRDPLVGERHLLLPVSQSGETADTLAAMREGARKGARTLAVCNVHQSTLAREADHVLYTHAGPEIGVAATKTFTSQVVALYLIALKLGRLRGALDRERVRAAGAELRSLPRLADETLGLWDELEGVARRHMHAGNFLFLGRGFGYPVALEGALKLKEISYIHAEGYASGEMKHGPIALIDEGVPVVIVANQPSVYPKVISNAEEVRARGGVVIALVDRDNRDCDQFADEVVRVPATQSEILGAVLATLPLQILAYHVATLKGTDVDQPRNLAKSVTVE